jgi:hypothetical protein
MSYQAKWSVHKFYVSEFDDPHDKCVVVLNLGTTFFVGGFISSAQANFLKSEKLQPCCCVIPVAQHPFLRYDSHFDVNFKNLMDFDLSRISEETLCGVIHPDTQAVIRQTFQNCPTLRGRYLRELLEE